MLGSQGIVVTCTVILVFLLSLISPISQLFKPIRHMTCLKFYPVELENLCCFKRIIRACHAKTVSVFPDSNLISNNSKYKTCQKARSYDCPLPLHRKVVTHGRWSLTRCGRYERVDCCCCCC